MKLILFAYLFLFFVFTNLIYAEEELVIPTQDLSRVFVGHHIPKTLKAVITPKPKNETLQKALQDTSNILRVGVVDEGTDYLHPALKDQIYYEFKKGKLDRIGKSLVNKSSFGYTKAASMVMYAFGAKGLDEKGRIIEALDNPLEKLKEMDDKFQEHILALAERNKEFKTTMIYAHLKEKFFSFFQMHAMKLVFDQSISMEDVLKDYKKSKKSGTLLSIKNQKIIFDIMKEKENVLKKSDKSDLSPLKLARLATSSKAYKEFQLSLLVEALAINRSTYRLIFEMPWNYIPESVLGGYLMQMDGFDQFLNFAEEAYKKVSNEYNYTSMFEIFKEYMFFNEKLLSVEDKDNTSINILIASLKKYNDVYATSSLKRILLTLCLTMEHDDFNALHNPSLGKEDKEKLINKIIENNIFNPVESYSYYLSKQEFMNMEEINRKALKNKKKLEITYPLIKDMLKDRSVENFSCKNDMGFLQSSLYKKYYKNRTDVSVVYEGSHGTHVAGIIAKQNKDIRIYPVQIELGNHEGESEYLIERSKEILKLMSDWLDENPLYVKAIKDRGDYFHNTYSYKQDVNIDKNYIMRKMEKYFDPKKIKYDSLSYKYQIDGFYQILDIIKLMGKEKIKVVNMSFGSDHEQLSEDMVNKRPDIAESEFIENIYIEFKKYYYSESIKKYAPETIFFIAAGNDGRWAEGDAHSAMPCSFYSSYLEPYRKLGLNIPQNDLKNLVCVGSIDSKNVMSSYTNIPIIKIPFIFAQGEGINSPVASYDCTGVEQLYNQVLKSGPLLDEKMYDLDFGTKIISSEVAIDPVKQELYSKADHEQKELYKAQEIEKKKQGIENYISLTKSMIFHQCLKNGKYYARYSGTSMATPMAAGYVASLILDKMNKLHLTDSLQKKSGEGIYNDPRFSVEQILADLEAFAPRQVYHNLGERVTIVDSQKDFYNFPSFILTK